MIYVAAEGGRGMQKRARALAQKHGVTDIPGLYVAIDPLYVREPGVVEGFIQTLDEANINPGLMIIDTLSRSFGNGEENASSDMGLFIESVTHLGKQRSVPMTTLIVHHSNATGARERGHTSLKCGANAMFQCVGTKSEKGHLLGVTLTNEKQKDDIDAAPIYLRAEPTRDSLVLEWEQMPEKVGKKDIQAKAWEARKGDMLRLLGAAENGYTWEEWRLVSNVAKSTFSRRVAQLEREGEIFIENGRWYTYPSTVDLAELGAEQNAVPLKRKNRLVEQGQF